MTSVIGLPPNGVRCETINGVWGMGGKIYLARACAEVSKGQSDQGVVVAVPKSA